MAKNAAGYMASNVAGIGRHYVSARLVRETGVTMRALRACNWLYVRRKLIDAGELADEWIPGHWTAEWRAQVLAVLAVVDPRRGPRCPVSRGDGSPADRREPAPWRTWLEGCGRMRRALNCEPPVWTADVGSRLRFVCR
jgi:hypothetical protein